MPRSDPEARKLYNREYYQRKKAERYEKQKQGKRLVEDEPEQRENRIEKPRKTKEEEDFFQDLVKQAALPDADQEKRELAKMLRYYGQLKESLVVSKKQAEQLEDLSFQAYERLLALCDRDTDLVQRLLHGRSKTSWDNEYRPEHLEKVKKALEENK